MGWRAPAPLPSSRRRPPDRGWAGVRHLDRRVLDGGNLFVSFLRGELRRVQVCVHTEQFVFVAWWILFLRDGTLPLNTL